MTTPCLLVPDNGLKIERMHTRGFHGSCDSMNKGIFHTFGVDASLKDASRPLLTLDCAESQSTYNMFL